VSLIGRESDVNSIKQLDDSAKMPDRELSVLIPARNEERSLQACLASILRQSEPGFVLGEQWELILVNDGSTDRTREIAVEATAGLDGVVVIDAPVLGADSGGLTGKCNACWAGAQIARGRHLLFTDADTVHQTNDISRALREAERHKAVLLSYSPRQVVTGFWQHAVMPLVFSELASVYPPKQVNDPARRLAAANGQFILVERDAYFSVGGHRAVGTSVLEDVALAENMKRGPGVIRFRYAPEALSTQMYRTTAEMIEGWTKNLVLLLPKPVALALWRVLDVVLFFGLPVAALGISWLIPWQRSVILLIWVRTLWRFYSRVARSNFPALDVAVSIVGVPLFVYLLICSVVAHRIKKSVTWKGRSYNILS
jgi:glycosyltransferase involved in cell wall biosynthesis